MIDVTIKTLVDITETGRLFVDDSNTKEYHQQQNLNALLQSIMLHSDIIKHKVSFGDQFIDGFDSSYGEESMTVWTLKVKLSSFDHGLLLNDVSGVPISGDLDNSVDFLVPVFDMIDCVNTVIEVFG